MSSEGSLWTMGIVLTEFDGVWKIDEYAALICTGQCDWVYATPVPTSVAMRHE